MGFYYGTHQFIQSNCESHRFDFSLVLKVLRTHRRNVMKKTWLLAFSVSASVFAAEAIAEPVDLTGFSCERAHGSGATQYWDFYGDVAVRRYSDASRPQQFFKVGEGAYEKYSRIDGEWDAIFYFFDNGQETMMRIYARPGMQVRDENPRAPWESGVVPFAANCVPLSEARF